MNRNSIRKLVFIRHSQSQVMPEVSAGSWPLTEEGKKRCIPLARELKAFQLQRIITSTEKKAFDTGRIIAGHLQIPCTTTPGLHEHEYTGPFLSQEAFLAGVARMFAEPDRPVFGQSGREALARFQQAVDDVCNRYPAGNLGIVTHGRILSLYLAAQTGRPALEIWQSLNMPDFRVL